MDDSTKNTTNPVVSEDQAQQSIGSMNKEAGSSGPGPVISEIRPSGPDVSHELSQELRGIEVKETTDKPDLTEEHRKMGVWHAGESIPVLTQPSGSVSLPMTRGEALADIKLKKPTDSGWGFDKLILKVLDALGLK